MVGAVDKALAQLGSSPTIPQVTAPQSPAEGEPSRDPNTSVAGAHQRRGPFWMEEPHWFWVLAVAIFLLGAALFLVAVGFDRP